MMLLLHPGMFESRRKSSSPGAMFNSSMGDGDGDGGMVSPGMASFDGDVVNGVFARVSRRSIIIGDSDP